MSRFRPTVKKTWGKVVQYFGLDGARLFLSPGGCHRKVEWPSCGGDSATGPIPSPTGSSFTYTSDPLPGDLEITGQPVATLHVASTQEDGAFFVYLEDVAPDGTVRYLTEGMLRALHRNVADEAPPYEMIGPHHTFVREDGEPLVPGQVTTLDFRLMPLSVRALGGPYRVRRVAA